MKVGLDLIEIQRIRDALERYPRFRERCFTEAEREYCDSRANPAQHYAARFAGKEAVGKALGFGVALEAIDADPGMTWMVGDDLEADVLGAKSCGLRTILVRTGKYRESTLEGALVKPDAIVDSLGDVPDYLARML